MYRFDRCIGVSNYSTTLPYASQSPKPLNLLRTIRMLGGVVHRKTLELVFEGSPCFVILVTTF